MIKIIFLCKLLDYVSNEYDIDNNVRRRINESFIENVQENRGKNFILTKLKVKLTNILHANKKFNAER